jgi:hypothetical protein
MDQVVIDDALRAKLDALRTPTELCDKQGRVLGVHTPTPDQVRRWYDWAKGHYSEEELDRRGNEPGEKTTAEVLNALRGS